MTPNFSARAYPWSALRRLTRSDAVVESMLARHLAAAPSGSWSRMRRLLRLDAKAEPAITIATHGTRTPVVATVAPDDPRAATRAAPSPYAATSPAMLDPHAAICAVDVDGVSLEVAGSSLAVRALVQRLLGGPAELAAPRPLGVIEQSLWALVVATALEDLGVVARVRPLGRAPSSDASSHVRLDITIADIALAVELRVPPVLATRAPRTPVTSGWLDRVRFDIPIVAGRCALRRDDLTRLAVRSLVTLERPAGGAGLELDIFGVSVPLSGERVTGYVPRDMSLPDTAHVELTVALGTKELSLRQITELAVGQIVQLGRPLGGPFELRAEGRVLGRGELVDVDGELAVRIVSLGD